MFLIMLGAPGAGKGTQAELLKNKFNIPQISTGELFRHEMEIGSSLGKLITSTMNSGNLVSDELTMEIFKNRVKNPDCAAGAIFDGIPRTVKQAELLSTALNDIGKRVDKVIYLALSDNEIISRLSGRWTCTKCGAIYHDKLNPPKTAGVCNNDAALLYQRDDQKPEVVAERIKVYKNSTYPLIEFYKTAGILLEINGQQEIEKIHQDILNQLR